MRTLALPLALVLLSACGEPDDPDKPDDTGNAPLDADGDGWPEGEDCDDEDPDINPDAEDDCDGIDNDCDGDIDEDGPTWYTDNDGDGFGNPENPTVACVQPSGTTDEALATDCNDGSTSIYPGAPEICDERDHDCDGELTPCHASLASVGSKLRGRSQQDEAGDGLAYLGDWDGDGLGDLAVGASHDSLDEVGGGVVPGGSGITTLEDATPMVLGSSYGAYLGRAIAAPGDVTGDGIDDLAVGLPWWGSYDNGHVLIYAGPTIESQDLWDATADIEGADYSDELGYSLAAAGDLNGDGIDDLVAGARMLDQGFGDEGAGAAYVLLGPITGSFTSADAVELRGPDLSGEAGTSVASGSDIDGDGTNDILVGAPEHYLHGYEGGAAFLVLGPHSTEGLENADAIYLSETYGDELGTAVAFVGDPTDDGSIDLALAAAGASTDERESAGRVYLFSGASGGVQGTDSADVILTGECRSAHAGQAVTGLGDFDGDGVDDLLITSYSADDQTVADGHDYGGLASVVTGPLSGEVDLADALYRLLGEDRFDEAGTTALGAGDLDGDGQPELVVGAPMHDITGEDDGAIYTVSAGDLP